MLVLLLDPYNPCAVLDGEIPSAHELIMYTFILAFKVPSRSSALGIAIVLCSEVRMFCYLRMFMGRYLMRQTEAISKGIQPRHRIGTPMAFKDCCNLSAEQGAL